MSPLTLSLPRVTLIDFTVTLSNARRFYSSMGNPTGVKGLNACLMIGLVKANQEIGVYTGSFPFYPYQEMKPELSYLAHHTNSIDKYREETCCVIGESCLFMKSPLAVMLEFAKKCKGLE